MCVDLTSRTLCHDFRDRIYAVLGICDELKGLSVRYDIDRRALVSNVLLHVQPTSLSSVHKLTHAITYLGSTRTLCKHEIEDLYQADNRSPFRLVPSGLNEHKVQLILNKLLSPRSSTSADRSPESSSFTSVLMLAHVEGYHESRTWYKSCSRCAIFLWGEASTQLQWGASARIDDCHMLVTHHYRPNLLEPKHPRTMDSLVAKMPR